MTHCAGDKTQTHLQLQFQDLTSSRAPSIKSEGEHTLDLEANHYTTQVNIFDLFATDTGADGPLLGAPGPEVIKIHGGGAQKPHRKSSRPKVTMQGTYASTTECILQNLTMKVGNPSAPWRAFTWTCALLQETNTQPWGNLQPAVQESLELAEAVDLLQLPGLHPLWKKHDLNVQGDANHFVNTLEPLTDKSIPLPVCRNPRGLPEGPHPTAHTGGLSRRLAGQLQLPGPVQWMGQSRGGTILARRQTRAYHTCHTQHLCGGHHDQTWQDPQPLWHVQSPEIARWLSKILCRVRASRPHLPQRDQPRQWPLLCHPHLS